MVVPIPAVLDAQQLESIRAILAESRFVDGRLSAGLTARKVKNNEEVPQDSAAIQKLNQLVMNQLYNHPVFQAAVMPLKLATPFYARYRGGKFYGHHVDDPIMGPPGGHYRTDVSMTVFLNQPDDYEGGELVIQTPFGEQKTKLAAGSAITYPSGSLHRVAEVTGGERLVAVSWCQSMVRSAEQREILYNLSQTRDALMRQSPEDENTLRLDHTYINLFRMWADV